MGEGRRCGWIFKPKNRLDYQISPSQNSKYRMFNLSLRKIYKVSIQLSTLIEQAMECFLSPLRFVSLSCCVVHMATGSYWPLTKIDTWSNVDMTTTKMTTPFVAISFPEQKGEKRSLFSARLLQLFDLVQQALGLTPQQTSKIYGYGCWCGFGGMGRTVDNFDL